MFNSQWSGWPFGRKLYAMSLSTGTLRSQVPTMSDGANEESKWKGTLQIHIYSFLFLEALAGIFLNTTHET